MCFLQRVLARRFVAAQAIPLGAHEQRIGLEGAKAGVSGEPLGQLESTASALTPLSAQLPTRSRLRMLGSACPLLGLPAQRIE